MLTLRELTQSFLMQPSVLTPLLASVHHSLFSWPVLGVLVALVLLVPSWFVGGPSRVGFMLPSSSIELILPQSMQGTGFPALYPHAGGCRRWPECSDGHFKSA